jgi:hypothetical protein
MLPKEIILFAIPLSLLMIFKSIQSIRLGEFQPNIVTWGIWSVNSGISTIIIIQNKVSFLQSLTSINSLLTCSLILICGLIFSNFKLVFTILDIICLALSILSLVLGLICNQALLGLIFAFITITIASIPTIIKSYYHPENESFSGYVTGTFIAILTMLSTSKLDFYVLSYPIIEMILNTIIILPIIKSKLKKINNI